LATGDSDLPSPLRITWFASEESRHSSQVPAADGGLGQSRAANDYHRGSNIFLLLNQLWLEQLQLEADGPEIVVPQKFYVLVGAPIGR
jgi:hypothetical protein